MKKISKLIPGSLVSRLALALTLAVAACGGDDDPIAEAAQHMCACENVNEPGTDVDACEQEVTSVIGAAADCVTCINDNAGAAATPQTCAALSTTCQAQCGFGEG